MQKGDAAPEHVRGDIEAGMTKQKGWPKPSSFKMRKAIPARRPE